MSAIKKDFTTMELLEKTESEIRELIKDNYNTINHHNKLQRIWTA
jgi:hypothetical protein